MSLLGDVVGLVSAFKSDKKTNKLNKQQLAMQQQLTDRQIDISKYIEELAKQVVGRRSDISDTYGNKSYYDEATGTYKSTLGGIPKQLQDASDQEELRRQVQDNAIRREGLNDFENTRNRAASEGETALSNLLAFRRGVGRVDAGRVGSQLRADRTGEVNAGYDDAERAAQTLQLRTGNAGIGDALSALARDRARAHASIGSPELEGIQFADEANARRSADLTDQYKLFSGQGAGFYDGAFNPSTAADKADARLSDAMKFDLSKYDLAMGGEGNAAATIGAAGAGQRQAYGQFMQNRIANPFGNFATGMDAAIEDAVKKIMSGGMG